MDILYLTGSIFICGPVLLFRLTDLSLKSLKRYEKEIHILVRIYGRIFPWSRFKIHLYIFHNHNMVPFHELLIMRDWKSYSSSTEQNSHPEHIISPISPLTLWQVEDKFTNFGRLDHLSPLYRLSQWTINNPVSKRI